MDLMKNIAQRMKSNGGLSARLIAERMAARGVRITPKVALDLTMLYSESARESGSAGAVADMTQNADSYVALCLSKVNAETVRAFAAIVTGMVAAT